MLLSAAPYDDQIVTHIRSLPERRYRRQKRDWCIPARRAHLRAVCALIGELEERGIDVNVSAGASARRERLDVGRAVLRDDVIEVAGAFSPRRLPALRALPERRFDADRKTWTVPLTRAGALAILELADHTDQLVTTQRARRALQRSAALRAPRTPAKRGSDGADMRQKRRSPVAHWRHYTAGPVFDNPARQRVVVPGIGLCVRIRVNPRRPSGNAPATTSATDSAQSVERDALARKIDIYRVETPEPIT